MESESAAGDGYSLTSSDVADHDGLSEDKAIQNITKCNVAVLDGRAVHYYRLLVHVSAQRRAHPISLTKTMALDEVLADAAPKVRAVAVVPAPTPNTRVPMNPNRLRPLPALI